MRHADVVKLVYTPDLGSGAARCGGSSPLIRTMYDKALLTILKTFLKHADVVKLVYTPDLGSGAARCGGSSPLIRTIYKLLS